MMAWLMRSLVILAIVGAFDAADPVPKRTAYNETLARKLLYLSAAAYAASPEPCVERTLHTSQKFLLATSMNYTCDRYNNICAYYVTLSDVSKEIIVAFRGTKTKRQLITEGWESTHPGIDFYGVGQVNKYFFIALNAMWDPLDETLKDPKYLDYKVTFTGHSLGGALASLAAMKTVLDKLRRSNQVTLYTFGQPRIGCHKFAMKHDELVPKSFRVINQFDLVPHAPPCAKNHHDPKVMYKDSSKPCDPDVESYPKDEDFNCSDSLTFELASTERYIREHRHYFGYKVVGLGKNGCVHEASIEEKIRSQTTSALGASKEDHSSSNGTTTEKPSALSKVLQGLGKIIGIDKNDGEDTGQ